MLEEATGAAVVGIDVVEAAASMAVVAVPVAVEDESLVGQPKRQRRPELMLPVVAQFQRSGAVVVVVVVGREADMEELRIWDRSGDGRDGRAGR